MSPYTGRRGAGRDDDAPHVPGSRISPTFQRPSGPGGDTDMGPAGGCVRSARQIPDSSRRPDPRQLLRPAVTGVNSDLALLSHQHAVAALVHALPLSGPLILGGVLVLIVTRFGTRRGR